MNALKEVIARLSATTGVHVSADVPAERPDAFVTVERGGGGVTAYDDRPSLTVQVWCRDRLAVEDLVERVEDSLLSMRDEVDGVQSVSVDRSYFPERGATLWPRYVLSVNAYCAR